MSVRWDVAVVGLGILGACTLRELALRGTRVVGIDALDPPHHHGSSHGRSRIIRDAYFEHPLYVPLVQRARNGWRQLEAESGRSLLRRTGLLMVGDPGGPVIGGSLRSVRAHRIPHRRLEPGEVRREWPGIRISSGQLGMYEAGAGVLDPEACVSAALSGARHRGAELLTRTRCLGWETEDDGVRIELEGPEEPAASPENPTSAALRARTLILAAGPWMGPLAGEPVASLLRVERQVAVWYAGTAPGSAPAPILLWEPAEGPVAYAIPGSEGGIKVARHHGGTDVEPGASVPGALPREVTAADRRSVAAALGAFLDGGPGPEVDASVCFYTNTPDGHFLLGRHPGAPDVILLGGGSGHAFKFAPVLAARAADLVPGIRGGDRGVADLWADGVPDPFDPSRFG